MLFLVSLLLQNGTRTDEREAKVGHTTGGSISDTTVLLILQLYNYFFFLSDQLSVWTDTLSEQVYFIIVCTATLYEYILVLSRQFV